MREAAIYPSDDIDKELYTEMMERIKRVQIDYFDKHKKELQRQAASSQTPSDPLNANTTSTFQRISHGLTRRRDERKLKRSWYKQHPEYQTPPNYFSTERIAIYSAIIGDYDQVREPYCTPDNCDFILFTDQAFDDSKSAWKTQDIPAELDGLSPVETNRYLKMHPQAILGDYRYSIYIDGNVQAMTDLTEYVNRLGSLGIGIHQHPLRDCVYQEMKTVCEKGKDSRENIARHYEYMQQTGMPQHYGLLECNVIVRDHANDTCLLLMDEWWQEFMTYSKRDQISLPHVLYRNGIEVKDVAILGPTVRRNGSFHIVPHQITTPAYHNNDRQASAEA